jgi:hypothetical protein
MAIYWEPEEGDPAAVAPVPAELHAWRAGDPRVLGWLLLPNEEPLRQAYCRALEPHAATIRRTCRERGLPDLP